eukprot:1159176-Pelagomonas_calceolata.AAC.4
MVQHLLLQLSCPCRQVQLCNPILSYPIGPTSPGMNSACLHVQCLQTNNSCMMRGLAESKRITATATYTDKQAAGEAARGTGTGSAAEEEQVRGKVASCLPCIAVFTCYRPYCSLQRLVDANIFISSHNT